MQSWREPSFFFYEKDQSSMGGSGGADKSDTEIFVYESPESRELNRRQRVECSQGWGSAFFKVDLQIVVAMGGSSEAFTLLNTST